MVAVAQISRAQKVGAFVAAAQKTLAHRAQANTQSHYILHRRLGSALFAGAKSTLSSVGHVAHLFWLEITGLFFLFFAVGFGAAAIREYRTWTSAHVNGGKLALVASFSLLFAWFGVTSFWRARKASKRR
jgi:glycerol uptake facilitator-like aquaporin